MQNTERDQSEHERQLDAIIAEFYRLSDTVGVADQSEFIQRYPAFSSELKDFFADAQLLHSQNHSDPIEHLLGPTIASGTSRSSKPAAGSVIGYFGEYEILEELGSGGMGVVYKARQTKLKRIVALKMIRSGELANSSDVKRFEAEARAAAKLSIGATIYDAAWSPSGKHIAFATERELVIVDAKSGEHLHEVQGNIGTVTSVAWSPDGLRIATGGVDSRIIIWDGNTLAKLLTLQASANEDTPNEILTQLIRSLDWSPDSRRLVSGGVRIQFWGSEKLSYGDGNIGLRK